MEPVYAWFQWLYEAHGINLTFIYDPFDRARMIRGVGMTVELSVVCILASLVIGMVGAWLQGSRLVWTRRAVQGFIVLFRTTPPLIQMYFFYFGIGSLLPMGVTAWGTPEPALSNVAWAMVSLSFFAGAFNVEIFRSGIEAVPRSTIEAAESLGFTRWQIYLRVVLPLAFRVCLPALNNNLVNLLKTTTLAYAIAVPEMLYVSKEIWGDASNVREMMVFLLVAYVALVGVLVWIMHHWERSMRIPGYGR